MGADDALHDDAVAIEEKTLVEEKSTFAVIADLVKARLTALVLITTLVGFYAGSGSPVDYWKMLHALIGTALVACGAAALNQLLEREQRMSQPAASFSSVVA